MWSACVDGVQTRSCSKIRNCYNGYEPETIKDCIEIKPSEEQPAEIQTPAELLPERPAVQEETPAVTHETKLTLWDQLMKAKSLALILLGVLLLITAGFWGAFAKHRKEEKVEHLIKKYSGAKKAEAKKKK